MDLWEKFQINERIADFWRELGMSAGTAIIVLIILYFVIKWAVKKGIKEAYKEIEKKKMYDKMYDDLRYKPGVNEDTNREG